MIGSNTWRIYRHFIKEKIDSKILKVEYIRTSKQTAEIFTKAVFRLILEKFVSKLGMYNPASGGSVIVFCKYLV